jgi:hypothetical protein
MIKFSKPAGGERFEQVQREVDKQFPAGRFVAVEGGQPVADAESHGKLVERLRALGKSPKGLVVIQAGAKYPDTAVIFGAALDRADA